jgi:hypothetical protein
MKIPTNNIRVFVLILLLLVAVSILFVKRDVVNDWLGCLAYWEQCSGEKMYNITYEECQKQEGMIAYLLDKKICIVSPSKE